MSTDVGIRGAFIAKRDDYEVNVTDGLFAIADALRFGFKELCKGDASDPRGAIEFLSQNLGESLDRVASSLTDIANALDKEGM